MSERKFNFNPGPAMLPLEVLEKAQAEFINYKGSGMSILETSHRHKNFEEVIFGAEALLKELLNVPENYRVLFIGMGATGQFDMIPMNYTVDGKVGNYVVTGSFASKAYKEGAKVGPAHIAATSEGDKYARIPSKDEIKLSENPAFLHITSNNTIYGTQWKEFYDFGDLPQIADMSSDILSKKFDVSKFALIYAGAQKNLGPSGVAIIIIRDDMIEASNQKLPVMLKYDTYAKNDSLYNTPSTFTIYMVKLVLEWVKGLGGLDAVEKINEKKAAIIYDTIYNSNGFYKGNAQKEFRSLMNITYKLPTEDLDKLFVAQAAEIGLAGLKGHRETGGIRASVYNAMPVAGCEKLAQFMVDFQKKNA
ncbi:MAG: 3-phosphoserine/phosphohydroxythreonine transaminase [Thermincola sp.]|nr:3-phosphoserine/phosphohydroxythreonine transaminase [Thermincola sp.]MDT3701922.1 3-phosphoserine/phosphohydroxythreonine transaminase [Thermincola sp.]